jgi:diguanylate cyclase (GGDEF)-like protein
MRSLFEPWTDPHAGDRVVCLTDLATDVHLISASTPVSEIDRIFRSERQLRSVVVQEGEIFSLLSRDQVEYTLTGRLGYGRGLHSRSTAAQLVPERSLALDGSMNLAQAAQRILVLPEDVRYRDVLVLTDEGPRVVSVSQIFQQLSADFRYAALHDSLTGLPNRRQLEERAGAILDSGRDFTGMAALYIDLDGFKAVNDTHGHRVGDQVLVAFAHRLREQSRPEDILGRLGGDEFVVLLDSVTKAQADSFAERIRLSAASPFACEGRRLRVSATIGIAMAEDTGEAGDLPRLEVLLRNADDAMRAKKQAGTRPARSNIRGGPAVTTGY